MAPTGYTVASAAALLGAMPPKRREIEDEYFGRMAAADKQNRDQSSLQRTPEVPRGGRGKEKKVTFTPSTCSIDGPRNPTRPFAAKEALAQLEGGVADHFQAEEVVSRAGTTGVAVAFSSSVSGTHSGSESDSSNEVMREGRRVKSILSNGKAAKSTTGQATNKDAAVRGAAAARPTASANKEQPADQTQPPQTPSLPFAHSHRLNANSTAPHPTGYTRIDTGRAAAQDDDDTRRGQDSAADGYTASATANAASSSSSNHHSRGRRSDEIYFTPVDVNRSTIEFEFFNAPMNAPRVRGSSSDESSFERGEASRSQDSPLRRFSSSKGKEPQSRYGHARKPSIRGRPRRTSSVSKTMKDRITVAPEQLDRLIVALANAPLVQTHLRKQWLGDDDEEVVETKGKPSLLSLRAALQDADLSDSAPSLTNDSTASDVLSDSSSALYSRANKTFIHEQLEPVVDGEYEDEQGMAEHRLARARPRAKFGGIALTDPKVHGAPIRFVSKGYKKGANCLQIGQCSFLNVPYGASVDCILRIEPGDIANGGAACSVTVQIMAQVLDRKKGRKIYLLVTEIDVTESLTKAVLVEFGKHTGLSLEDIEVVQPDAIRHDSFRESVDWCQLADELQATCSTNDIIEDAAAGFKHLDKETCTMQTLTLLSELERIKAQHVDFLILRSTATAHANGMPTGITVPWISQHLDAHVGLWSPEASSLFREDLVAAVAKRHMDGEAFAVRALWGRKRKIVRCVPLLEGDGGRTAAWVAFVGDEFDF